MNNNEFNNQENTENYSSQDAGIELLHRVIESNKAVEISGKAIFHMYCDIKEDVKKIKHWQMKKISNGRNCLNPSQTILSQNYLRTV